MKPTRLFAFLVLLLLVLAVLAGPRLQSVLFGPPKYSGPALPPSTVAVPHARSIAWKIDSALTTDIYRSWADRPLTQVQSSGKGSGTRILLGHLLARRQVAETNALICTLKPWGVAGTSGWQNPHGDYDFEEAVYTTLLNLFGDNPSVLTPAARDRVLNVLLTEEGNAFRTFAPHTLGLSEETENHMLMTEGSRYLKNRWLNAHGNSSPRYDNVANGMEAHLLSFLGKIRTSGFHEFNSQPYIGYTFLGLLNLEAFASDPVRTAARDDLDYANWSYALGSYRLRHFPPFRRRYEYAKMTSLTEGYQTAYLDAWLSYAPESLALPKLEKSGLGHALIGACLSYRPPDAVVRLLFDKGAGYFVQMGHGRGASPEIYSAGRHFLLSAGGVHRDERSVLVARPITLLGDYEGDNVDSLFHLAGPGDNFRTWNDTGVFKNFACAAGPVSVPVNAAAVAGNQLWKIYSPSPGLLLAVHSTPDAGMMAVFESTDPAALLTAVTAANPDPAALRTSFQFPGGSQLTYDLNSPHDRWVMISAGGKPLDREFDRWPLIAGDL